MTGMRINRETGLYEVQASIKAAIVLGGALLSLVVGVATYSITITRAFGEVTQNIALLQQESTMRATAFDARIRMLELSQSNLNALADAVRSNTEMIRQLSDRQGEASRARR